MARSIGVGDQRLAHKGPRELQLSSVVIDWDGNKTSLTQGEAAGSKAADDVYFQVDAPTLRLPSGAHYCVWVLQTRHQGTDAQGQ